MMAAAAAAALGPGESPTQQAPNAGVPPEGSPIEQSPISAPAAGALEESSDHRAQAESGLGLNNSRSAGGFSWLAASGFSFLTFNSAVAIYQSWGNAEEISIHAFTYSNIIALFICLRLFQAEPANSHRRNKYAVHAWFFTMSLVFGFAYQIDEVTTKPTLQVALLLWSMPAAAAIGVFILLFRQDHSPDAPEDEELLSPV